MNLFSHTNLFTTEIEKEKELSLKKNIWDNLFSKKSQKKDGKCLFPQEWTRVFSKKLAIVNKFSCIAFDHRALCKKARLFTDCPV